MKEEKKENERHINERAQDPIFRWKSPISWTDIHDFPILLFYEIYNWRWPDHWTMEMTDEEVKQWIQRKAAFNTVEKFLWRFALPYRASIMFGFFFNFTTVISVIGGNIWDFYEPMPPPFDLSWGRRCFNHPQYIYLYHHDERIAKTSVYTKIDDLYVQATMEHITTALFAIPGIVMPYVLFKAAYRKNYEKLIYWLAWFGAMTVRSIFEICIYGFRFIMAEDIGTMLLNAENSKIPLWYLTFRHLLTFYPTYTFPFLLWIHLSLAIHYRSFTRVIPAADRTMTHDESGTSLLLLSRMF